MGLGYLLVQANYVDEALIDLYWIVSGRTEVDVLKDLRGRPLGPLGDAVATAYEAQIQDPQLRRQFEELKPLLKATRDVRNDFIHAYYVFGGDHLRRTRRPKSGAAVEMIRKLRASDIEAALATLGQAQDAVLAVYDATVEHLPPVQARFGAVAADGTYTPAWTIPPD